MLRERIIELLETDCCLFEPLAPVTETGGKRTPLQFNFPGLICKAAGFTPQLSNGFGCQARLPMNAPHVDPYWIAFEEMMSADCHWRPIDREMELTALARQLWAAEYGDEEAKRLPFYDKNQNVQNTRWWDSQKDVTTEDVLAVLKGQLTFRINSCIPESSS